MKRIPILILAAALLFCVSGCGSQTKTVFDAGASDSAAVGMQNAGKVNYEEDAFDLMGMEYQAFLQKYDDSMIAEYSTNAYEADYHYVLKNGVEASIYDGIVVSVRTFYYKEAEHPVPVLKGIGGGDGYDAVVGELGEPYYDGTELAGEDEKEFYAAVFYLGRYQYLKVYFENETKQVSHIFCFYGEAPELQEAGGIKIGDSLAKIKSVYNKLYYGTVFYDPSQGGPKYNRLYYVPIEDRDRGVECLEFYLYDKKVVRITSGIRDILEWRNYEDIFGRKDVYKENNMIGHHGSIIYFYDDAAGKEQVLLKVENCATEEKDVDSDGITEIIVYKAGKMKAIDIYDYNADTEMILHLDVCAALGAYWSEYMGNAANAKPEYSRCIEAGFHGSDGSDRTEVYSVKDNILTYIGPHSQEMYQ